jgi:hypothetical protein
VTRGSLRPPVKPMRRSQMQSNPYQHLNHATYTVPRTIPANMPRLDERPSIARLLNLGGYKKDQRNGPK